MRFTSQILGNHVDNMHIRGITGFLMGACYLVKGYQVIIYKRENK